MKFYSNIDERVLNRDGEIADLLQLMLLLIHLKLKK